MRVWNAAVIAAFFICSLSAGPARAQDVSLRFADGSLAVSGPLLGFDGAAYRVETRFGELTIRAASVTCEGACPKSLDPAYLGVSGSARTANVLFPALVQAFALDRGLPFAIEALDDTHSRIILGPAEAPVLEIALRATNTSEGFADLFASEADVVLADRLPLEAEAAAAAELGLGDLSEPGRRFVLARSNLRLYGGDAGEVDRLTPADFLAASALPELHVAARDADAAIQVMRRLARVLGRERPVVGWTLHDRPEDVLGALAADPAALGLTADLLFTQRTVAVLEGCAPLASIGAADPLTLAHWVIVPRRRLPVIAEDLVTYLNQSQAQRVVDRAGFASLDLRGQSLSLQGDRLMRGLLAADIPAKVAELRAAVALLAPLQRLPVAFRFEADIAGSEPVLTPVSEGVLRQLISRLDASGDVPVVVGFGSDKAAALVRAENIAGRLAGSAQAVAVGDVLRVTCESSAWGAHMNSRVEIWVPR